MVAPRGAPGRHVLKGLWTVQPVPKHRSLVPACVASLCALLIGAPLAAADPPPDISGSSIYCIDTDEGLALRAGEDIKCGFTASMAQGTESATITATVVLPPEVEYASATQPSTYDDLTRTITYGPNALGLTFQDETRPAEFHVTLNAGVAPGTVIAPAV